MCNTQRIIDQLRDENPDAVLFDNMETAVLGYGRAGHTGPVAVYSKMKMYAKLKQDGFSNEDAEEYFNKFVGVWAGEHTPVILEDLPEE